MFKKRIDRSKEPAPFVFRNDKLNFIEEILSPSGLWRAIIVKDSQEVYRYLLYHWDLSNFDYLGYGYWQCHESASYFGSVEIARENALEGLKAKSGERFKK